MLFEALTGGLYLAARFILAHDDDVFADWQLIVVLIVSITIEDQSFREPLIHSDALGAISCGAAAR